MEKNYIIESIKQVKQSHPLLDCITNYVTVNDCANIILAYGGSPVMADCPEEVEEFVSISQGLNINIGTMSESMRNAALIAGKCANRLGIPVTLDPVGVGAATLRTKTALELLHEVKFAAIRGNMSEMKTLIYGVGATSGVDVSESDTITADNWREYGELLRNFSKTLGGTVLAASGPIDVIANSSDYYGVLNGTPTMTQITGCGCMLTSIVCLWIAGCRKCGLGIDDLKATLSAICTFGVCGEVAEEKTKIRKGGTGTFHMELFDAASTITPEEVAERARIIKG